MKTRRLVTERLEHREMFAVSAVLSGGVLTVTGSDQPEAYTLNYLKSTDKLTLNVGSQFFTFQASSIRQIVANLGAGNDNWNGLASGFKAPQTIRGGLGNDAITTGEGNDTIYGDAGNDSLIPWAGADKVFGGDGDDWIALTNGDGGQFGYPSDVAYGERGNDTLIGGSNDQIFGGDGDDQLTASGHGVFGGTYMDGGNGNDRFRAAQGQYKARDTIVGGDGYDVLENYDTDSRGSVLENLPRNNSIERIG
jgi:Ca2+-binding RTX toxin-like protein